MKWLKRLVVFVVVLFVALVAVAFVLPGSAHVERSVSIARPPPQVFAVVNDMTRFNEWSPWYGLDPNAKYTLTGPASGVGAKLAWEGDPSTVGTGSQEIVESVPDERTRVQLDFGPMGKPVAAFVLAPEGEGTRVTWLFDSTLPLTFDGNFGWNLMGRYMGLMFDSMVGNDYERGLAKLKSVVEAQPLPVPAPVAPEPAPEEAAPEPTSADDAAG